MDTGRRKGDHIPGDATGPGLKQHGAPGEPPVLGQAAGAEMGLERGTRSRYRGYLWASQGESVLFCRSWGAPGAQTWPPVLGPASGRLFSLQLSSGSPGEAQVDEGENHLCVTPPPPGRLPLQGFTLPVSSTWNALPPDSCPSPHY